MNFKKISWHARLWMWSFGGDEESLPKDFCSYFKQVLLSILLFPVTVFSGIVVWKRSSDMRLLDRLFLGFVMSAMIACLYCIGYMTAETTFNQGGIWAHIYAIPSLIYILFCVSVWVFVISCIFRGVWFILKKGRKASKTIQKNNIFAEYIKAKKNKYCPKIDWE